MHNYNFVQKLNVFVAEKSDDSITQDFDCGSMNSDFLSYSLGTSVTPRLSVFQSIPVDFEKKSSGSKSSYSDFYSELSEETDMSVTYNKSRRYSITSQTSFGETFSPEAVSQ